MMALYLSEVAEAADVEGLENLYLNSSEFKRWEFKKHNPEDLTLTEEARAQYGLNRPTVPLKNCINGLAQFLNKYSSFAVGDDIRPLYGLLSELTHPSQFSITYWFTSLRSSPILTSDGAYPISEYAPYVIVQALSHIALANEMVRQVCNARLAATGS